ncbi:hypothetical protein DIPPA_07579 [Diplonema papillatum]|nr:hypothetical protein DIPPA_07579 [Diplonema papillatum]
MSESTPPPGLSAEQQERLGLELLDGPPCLSVSLRREQSDAACLTVAWEEWAAAQSRPAEDSWEDLVLFAKRAALASAEACNRVGISAIDAALRPSEGDLVVPPFAPGIRQGLAHLFDALGSRRSPAPNPSDMASLSLMLCLSIEAALAANQPAAGKKKDASAALLKDLIAPGRPESAPPAARALLRALFLPAGLNLRNLLSHGFLCAEACDAAFAALLLLLCLDLAPRLPRRRPAAAGRLPFDAPPLLALLQRVPLPFTFGDARHRLLRRIFTADPSSFVVRGRASQFAEGFRYLAAGQCIAFLLRVLPAFEMCLRVLFCNANGTAEHAEARAGAYFATLDGFGQRDKHIVLLQPSLPGGGGEAEAEENALGTSLGSGLFSLLADLFMAEAGPSLRAYIMHAQCDIAHGFPAPRQSCSEAPAGKLGSPPSNGALPTVVPLQCGSVSEATASKFSGIPPREGLASLPEEDLASPPEERPVVCEDRTGDTRELTTLQLSTLVFATAIVAACGKSDAAWLQRQPMQMREFVDACLQWVDAYPAPGLYHPSSLLDAQVERLQEAETALNRWSNSRTFEVSKVEAEDSQYILRVACDSASPHSLVAPSSLADPEMPPDGADPTGSPFVFTIAESSPARFMPECRSDVVAAPTVLRMRYRVSDACLAVASPKDNTASFKDRRLFDQAMLCSRGLESLCNQLSNFGKEQQQTLRSGVPCMLATCRQLEAVCWALRKSVAEAEAGFSPGKPSLRTSKRRAYVGLALAAVPTIRNLSRVVLTHISSCRRFPGCDPAHDFSQRLHVVVSQVAASFSGAAVAVDKLLPPVMQFLGSAKLPKLNQKGAHSSVPATLTTT